MKSPMPMAMQCFHKVWHLVYSSTDTLSLPWMAGNGLGCAGCGMGHEGDKLNLLPMCGPPWVTRSCKGDQQTKKCPNWINTAVHTYSSVRSKSKQLLEAYKRMVLETVTHSSVQHVILYRWLPSLVHVWQELWMPQTHVAVSGMWESCTEILEIGTQRWKLLDPSWSWDVNTRAIY